MGIDTRLQDGGGSRRFLKVDRNRSALTGVTGFPPEDPKTILKPFVSLMANAAGATSMLVDGSVTTKDFFIESDPDYDRQVLTLAFTIADAGATFNKFGNISALSNGCQMFYEDKDLGDVFLSDALKSNFDFVQICNFKPAFGGGTSAFKSSNVEGSSEAYNPVLDVKEVFGLQYGVKIPKGSNKKIVFRIRDDVSGVDRFDIKVFGYDVVHNGEGYTN